MDREIAVLISTNIACPVAFIHSNHGKKLTMINIIMIINYHNINSSWTSNNLRIKKKTNGRTKKYSSKKHFHHGPGKNPKRSPSFKFPDKKQDHHSKNSRKHGRQEKDSGLNFNKYLQFDHACSGRYWKKLNYN